MCEAHRQAEAAAAVAAPPAIDGITFHVSDMTCDHCAGVIRSALEEKVPGVDISIDVGNARVTVTADEAIAADVIRLAGYNPQRVSH